MGLNHSPRINTEGLVLYLDSENTKSYPGYGTSWYDLSKIGGEGVLTNSPVFENDRFSFDGASDYVRVTRSDLNAGSFAYGEITCFLWIKPSSLGNSDNRFNNLITVEYSFEVSIGNNNNGYSGLAYASNPWAWYGTNNNVLQNEVWNLVTFVHAFTGRWLYVNGTQVFYQGNSGFVSNRSNIWPYLTLMGRNTGTGSQAEGGLSTVLLFNRPFGVDEIKQYFNATRSRFGI